MFPTDTATTTLSRPKSTRDSLADCFGRVAYTNSKLINSGAEDVLAGDDPGIQNPLRGALDDRALSRDDIPQSLILAWSYELPFGKGKRYNFTGPRGQNRRRLEGLGHTTLRRGASA